MKRAHLGNGSLSILERDSDKPAFAVATICEVVSIVLEGDDGTVPYYYNHWLLLFDHDE